MELEELIISVKDNMYNLDKYENYYFAIALRLFEKTSSDLEFKYENIFIDKIQSMAEYYGQDYKKNTEEISQLKVKYFQYFYKVKEMYNKLFLTCLKNFMNCFNEPNSFIVLIFAYFAISLIIFI